MHNTKVLLVDDESNITAALTRSLGLYSWDIFAANSAREGLEILERIDIDVVLSDEQMPEMVGSEFLAEVRKKYPQTIRMILTGQADLDTAIRAINEGEVYRYFTKPCNHKELATAIKQGLQHKQLVMQSRFLLQEYKKQALIIEELEKKIPETAPVEQEREENIFEDTVKIDLENLLKDFD